MDLGYILQLEPKDCLMGWIWEVNVGLIYIKNNVSLEYFLTQNVIETLRFDQSELYID